MRLRVLEGRGKTDRNGQRIPVDPFEGDDALPEPPAELTKQAQRTWRHIVRILGDAGVVKSADAYVLAYFCELDRLFWREIDRGKFVSMNGVGQLRMLLVELGMTPSARSRLAISLGKQQEREPLGRLRSRNGTR
jgi:phage terminase small subunit